MNSNKICKKVIVATSLSVIALQLNAPLISYANDWNSYEEIIRQDKLLVNKLVDEGYLKQSNDGFKITQKYKDEINNRADKTKYDVFFTENTVMISLKISLASYRGVNKVVFNKNSTIDLYLDNQNAKNLEDGSGLLSILSALIPEAMVSKVATVVFGISSIVIKRANNKGRGIIIKLRFKPGINLPAFWLSVIGVSSQWQTMILDCI